MNVDSILVSDYASVSGGKLTVIGVFNKIGPAPLPVRLQQITVSLVIHGHHSEAGGHHRGEVRLINSDREVLTTMPLEFTFAGHSEVIRGLPVRHISTHTILVPVFEKAGAYAFEVYIDDTYHAAASFAVVPVRE